MGIFVPKHMMTNTKILRSRKGSWYADTGWRDRAGGSPGTRLREKDICEGLSIALKEYSDLKEALDDARSRVETLRVFAEGLFEPDEAPDLNVVGS